MKACDFNILSRSNIIRGISATAFVDFQSGVLCKPVSILLNVVLAVA